MEIGDIVEHINKESTSGYPHDKKYVFKDICRMKDPITGNWRDAAMYVECNSENETKYIRDLSEFKKNFKVVG